MIGASLSEVWGEDFKPQKKVKKKVVLPLMTIVLGDAYFNPSVLRTSQSDA